MMMMIIIMTHDWSQLCELLWCEYYECSCLSYKHSQQPVWLILFSNCQREDATTKYRRP